MDDKEKMPVFYPQGIFTVGEDNSFIVPIDLLAGDVIYSCAICGIVRVDRGSQTVFTKDHDHKFFIDPANWVVSSGDNHG